MRVGLRLNELDVNVHAVACLLHAAFENIRNTQVSRDLGQIFRRAFVMRRRSARDYSQPADLGKGGDNFILNALREKCVLLVRAQIVERQNRDAFVRSSGRGCSWRRGSSRCSICRSCRWLTRKEPDRSADNQERDDCQERNIRTKFWPRRRDVGRYRTSGKLLRQRGVSGFFGVKVDDRNGDTVLYLTFAEIMQVPLPLPVLAEI